MKTERQGKVRYGRRRLVTVITVVVLGCLLAAGVMLQSRAREARIHQLLPQAQAALDDGNYPLTVSLMEAYLDRYPENIEALANYAELRLLVPLPNGGHYRKAIDARLQLIRLVPDNQNHKVSLLRLYDKSLLSTEAIRLGEQMLKEDPDNTEVLLVLARQQTRTRRFDRAQDSLDRLLAIDPINLNAHALVFTLMRERNLPLESFRRHASVLVETFPDEANAWIASALGYALVGDGFLAKPLVDRAVPHLDGDLHRFRFVSEVYDRIGDYQTATDLYEMALNDPRLVQVATVAIRRLWEAQRYEILLTLEDNEDAIDAQDRSIRHLITLARHKTRRDDTVDGVPLNRGAEVAGDYEGLWNALIPYITGDASVTPNQLQYFRQALERYPRDPQLAFFVGELLLRQGASEEAITVLARASTLSPTWAAPYARLSQALRLSGSKQLSLAPAYQAVQRAPDNVGLVLNFLEAAAVNLDQFSDPQALRLRETYWQVDPEGELLSLAPLDVAFAASDGLEKGQERMSKWMAHVGEMSPEVLWAMLGVSEAAGLGQEVRLIEAASQQRGVDAALASMWAMATARNERSVDAGWELFRRLEAEHGEDLAWKIAEADVAERLGRKDRIELWRSLFSEHPDNPRVVRALLKATSPWSDLDFIEEAVAVLAALYGADDYAVKWAKVRLLVQRADSDLALTEATADLTSLANKAPWLLEPQELMARCQVRLANWTLAAQYFGSAYRLAPHRWDLRLEEARSLDKAGQRPVAVTILTSAESEELDDPTQIANHAKLWLTWGRHEDAKRLLDSFDKEVDPLSELGRLRTLMSAASGDRDAALAGAQSLASSGRPQDVLAAINILGRLNASEELALLAGQVENSELEAGEKSYMAGLLATYLGNVTDAASAFLAASSDEHYGSAAMREWLLLGLRTGDPEIFRAAGEQVVKRAVNDPVLMAVGQRSDILASHLGGAIRTLIVELIQGVVAGEQAWPIIEGLIAAGQQTQDPVDWRPLVVESRQAVQAASNSSGFRQALISSAYFSGDLRAAEEAADVAARVFAEDIQIRQLQLAIHMELRQWDRVVDIGEALAELSPHAHALGLLASSEAWVQLNDGEAAINSLEAIAREGQIDLTKNSILRNAWLRAKMVRGDRPETLNPEMVWEPLSPQSAIKLIRSLLATSTTATVGEAWADWFTEHAGSFKAGQDPQVILALVAWWRVLHERYGEDRLGERAIPLLAQIRDDPIVGERSLIFEGQLYEILQQDELAERSYRAALQGNENLLLVVNNLAMVLSRLDQGDEAVRLAKRAVAGAPHVAAVHDTHAEALRAAGRPKEAVTAARRAVEMAPGEIEFQLTLGFALVDAHETDEAASLLEDLTHLAGSNTWSQRQLERLERLRQHHEASQLSSSAVLQTFIRGNPW